MSTLTTIIDGGIIGGLIFVLGLLALMFATSLAKSLNKIRDERRANRTPAVPDGIDADSLR